MKLSRQILREVETFLSQLKMSITYDILTAIKKEIEAIKIDAINDIKQ